MYCIDCGELLECPTEDGRCLSCAQFRANCQCAECRERRAAPAEE